MNVTFMIGNGFDLNLGLKTQYKDFIKWYVETASENYVIEKFKKDIIENLNTWADAEMAFGKYTGNFYVEEVEDFCDCHQDFIMKLVDYLKREELKFTNNIWEDDIDLFGSCLMQISENLNQEQKHLIGDDLNINVETLNFNFFTFNYTQCLKHILSELGEEFYPRGYVRHCRISNIVEAHGSISEENIVFGLNDKSQISNLELFTHSDDVVFLEQILKPQINEFTHRDVYKVFERQLETTDFVYVFGMSLGESDKIWWEMICNWLHKKVTAFVNIYQMDVPSYGFAMHNFRRAEKEIREKLISYSYLSSSQKTEISKRIYLKSGNVFPKMSMMDRTFEMV